MFGNFSVFSFLWSWKLTCFLTTCLSATWFSGSQERKYTKISMQRNIILSSIRTLLKTNLSYLELFLLQQFISTIDNIRFEIYLRFIWIQTYRIFYPSWRLFAKHHTSSSCCRIFSCRSTSRKIRLSIFCLLLPWWYRFYLKLHFHILQSSVS